MKTFLAALAYSIAHCQHKGSSYWFMRYTSWHDSDGIKTQTKLRQRHAEKWTLSRLFKYTSFIKHRLQISHHNGTVAVVLPQIPYGKRSVDVPVYWYRSFLGLFFNQRKQDLLCHLLTATDILWPCHPAAFQWKSPLGILGDTTSGLEKQAWSTSKTRHFGQQKQISDYSTTSCRQPSGTRLVTLLLLSVVMVTSLGALLERTTHTDAVKWQQYSDEKVACVSDW